MNRDKRGVLVGMVLGDGCLRVRRRLKNGKYPYIQSEFRMKHSYKQRAYLEHKAEIIAAMFGGMCKVHDTYVMLKGVRHEQVLATKSNKYFRILYKVMYPDGKKTYTRRVLDYLTPHGIALWYLDDGHARTNVNSEGWISSCSTEIATCCSLEEVEIIKTYFKEKHDISVKLFLHHKDQWSIRMNTADSKKFAMLIAPYVPACMMYKMAHVSSLNVHECRAPAIACKSCGIPAYATDRRKGLCLSCYHRQYRKKQKGEDIVRANGNETVRSS
jgi:hypothetical protein